MSVDLSPDGQWIAFDLLGHVYRIPAQGGEAQSLTQDSGVAVNYHPAWSPDGSKIAFVSDRSGQYNLWVMNADGSDPKSVMVNPAVRVTDPTWMPDGQYIIVQRTLGYHRISAAQCRYLDVPHRWRRGHRAGGQ